MMQLQAIGNIGKDATVVESNGNKFIAFNVAQTDKFKNKKGEIVEKTTWIKCYGNYDHLKNLVQYLTKGVKVYIQGGPSFHKWKNENTKQMEIDLRCTIEKIQLLSPKKNDSDKNNKQNVEKSNEQETEDGFCQSSSDTGEAVEEFATGLNDFNRPDDLPF